MFTSVFVAASQFFTMFTTLFSAGDKACKALEHLATWSEETANQFNETARIERNSELYRMRHAASLEQAALDADKPAAAPVTPAKPTKAA